MLDHSDLADAPDIPTEVPLPEAPHLDRSEHEAIKEWVLAVSMDNKVRFDTFSRYAQSHFYFTGGTEASLGR